MSETPPPPPSSGSETPKEAKARAKADRAYQKASRPWYQKKRFIIPGAIVLVIILFAALSGGDTDPDETAAGDSETNAAATQNPTATEQATSQPTAPATPTEPATGATEAENEPTAEGETGSREAPLEVGTSASLGDWDVTVDEIQLDAGDAISGANEFNEEPQNGNYALITLTATYQGEEEGDAGFELIATLSGADNRQYSDADCMAVEPDPLYDQPTVETGGTVTGQFCIDYPDEAIGDDAVLFVEESFSFDDVRAYWALPNG